MPLAETGFFKLGRMKRILEIMASACPGELGILEIGSDRERFSIAYEI
jgi:hypothetical protein